MATIICATAEDHLADLVRHALTREGVGVRVAHTGRDALRLMRAHRLDLIILDDTLPDMGSIAVLATLRTFSQVPVLMIAAPGSGDGDGGARLGQHPVDYLATPFSIQILVERVKAMLRWGTGNLGADDTVQ